MFAKITAFFITDINLIATALAYVCDTVSDRPKNNGSRGHAQTATCGSLGVRHMTNLVKRFVKDESGATAIEYGLIAAGISVAIIAVVQGLGSKLNTTLGSVSTALK